ncbi:SMC-Scp complex subunit ScpB [Arthrobacter roseus]|uniref:SMC-Scp complex subunit ScpB n=1 Tax=Arthrobacter roseus TaxID=136274 RepID=UPI001964FA3F|nr:SMC-Scp complex subunit ScpB [Arthrobacter roseus]MBM7848295.1 segregation and condensation protein B [Arthrobacter roseus]
MNSGEPQSEHGGEDAPTSWSDLAAPLEAVLMVVGEPVRADELAEVLKVPLADVLEALENLRREYDGYTGSGASESASRSRGFELRQVASGWRFYSRSEFAPVVSQFVTAGQSARLSQAALETLAVIAYRQPVSRARVSAIRGVNVDSVVRTLVVRGMVEECGTELETGSLRYRTTPHFLERLGLDYISELPRIAPHLAGVDNLADVEDSTTY